MMHSGCICVCVCVSICMQICTYGFFLRESVNHGAKCLRLKWLSRGTNSNHTQGGFVSRALLGD